VKVRAKFGVFEYGSSLFEDEFLVDLRADSEVNERALRFEVFGNGSVPGVMRDRDTWKADSEQFVDHVPRRGVGKPGARHQAGHLTVRDASMHGYTVPPLHKYVHEFPFKRERAAQDDVYREF